MLKLFQPKTRTISLLWEYPGVGFHNGEGNICLYGHIVV